MSAASLKLVESVEPATTKPRAKSITKSAPPKAPPKTKAASPAAKKRAAAPKPKKREALALDLMTSPAAACSVHATLNDAAHLMWEKNLGALIVVDDDGFPVSMLTDRDVSMAAYTQGVPLYHAAITSAMSQTLVTAKTTTPVDELREMMAEARVRRVAIVDEADHLCGVVGLADILAEAVAPLPKDRKRGTTPAMLVQLVDALFSPAEPAQV